MQRTLIASAILLAATHFAHAADFTLTSPDIKAAGMIDRKFEFNGFGCSGENKSPALKWTGAPKGTRSFAVSVFDPDAPTGAGWWHWSVVDIPASVTELAPDAGAAGGAKLPKGAIPLQNDFDQIAWGGVCPPEGDKAHRYVFTVHALKLEKLAVPTDATAASMESQVKASSIGNATFTARYERPKK